MPRAAGVARTLVERGKARYIERPMMASSDPQNRTFQPKTHDLFEPSGALRPFQHRKYAPKLELLRAYGLAPDDEVLDVGVGYGAWLSLLEREGQRRLHGMDPFEGSIGIARERTSASIRVGRIEQPHWPFEEGFFRVVTCFDVVEHLERPAAFFEHVRRYLRPDGLVIVTTPLYELGYRLRGLPWVGRPDTNPTHINVLPPAFWTTTAQRAGFGVLRAWRGESLTHVRYVEHVGALLGRLGVDHRNVPLLRQFEQSFCLLLRPSPEVRH
jgi:SAM-dependent methyltransferase